MPVDAPIAQTTHNIDSDTDSDGIANPLSKGRSGAGAGQQMANPVAESAGPQTFEAE